MTEKFYEVAITKYAKSVIVLCWLITTALYLKQFGIVTSLEAEKYISEAKNYLSTGTFSAPRYWFYCVTIFIIATALKLKIGLTGAFVLQALLNLFAYLYLYGGIKKIFNYPLTPLVIILYLQFFWPYQSWVTFLFTESAFYSLILILTATIIRCKPDSFKNILLILLALFFVLISRPLGILFAGSLFLYVFYCANKKWKLIMGLLSLLLIAGGFYIINTIFSTIHDWHITQAFEQESIICDLPGTEQSHTKLALATDGSPVYQLYFYLTHNTKHFIHFAGIKLRYFYLMTRPYYSNAHNYFLLCNVLLIYVLIITGAIIKSSGLLKPFNLFLTTTIVLYTITIIFQCDDFHNRFVFSIFPFFVLLAAQTAEWIASTFFKTRNRLPVSV